MRLISGLSWPADGKKGCGGGCLSCRMSRTVLEVTVCEGTALSRGSVPPSSLVVISRKASFTFPFNMNLGELFVGKLRRLVKEPFWG